MNKKIIKHCLVTGGAGFLGTHLIQRLLNIGYDVSVFDIVSPIKTSLLNALKLTQRVKYIQGDIRNQRDLLFITNSHFDIVFHLAAQPISGLSNIDPDQTIAINAQGTRNICEAINNTGGSCLVLSSSACAYGLPLLGTAPLREDAPLQPGFYAYSKSKQEAERAIFEFKKLKCAIGRFINIYGPGDRHFSRITPRIIRDLISGCTELRLTRNAQTIMDFLYVDDAVDGLLALANYLEKCHNPNLEAPIFNFGVGTDNALQIKSLVNKISIAFDGHERPVLEPNQPSEPTVTKYLDPGKAINQLGWKAKIQLDEGLKKTIAWYTKHINLIEHLEDQSMTELFS
jgi:CDP-glucose 4,6-dehydratase